MNSIFKFKEGDIIELDIDLYYSDIPSGLRFSKINHTCTVIKFRNGSNELIPTYKVLVSKILYTTNNVIISNTTPYISNMSSKFVDNYYKLVKPLIIYPDE